MKRKTKKSKNFNKIILTIVIVIIIAFIAIKSLIAKKTNESVLGTSTCVLLNVPAYFDSNYWTIANSNLLPGTVLIINPSNGPGSSLNSNYVTKVQNTKNKQGKVFGYVFTEYGTRSATVVKAEIDKYKSWYGVTNIFLDEVSSSSSDYSYYQDLADYIHQTSGALVQLNPGVYPAEGYMNIGDIVTTFESHYDKYATKTVPSWVSNYPSSKFAHLIYAVPNATAMNTVFTIAKERNVGYIYITSDDLPNPWDSLPNYWNEEVVLAQNNCNNSPTIAPTVNPTVKPTIKPTTVPTMIPTRTPTTKPTIKPTTVPTTKPTAKPTVRPTIKPTSSTIIRARSSVSGTEFWAGGTFRGYCPIDVSLPPGTYYIGFRSYKPAGTVEQDITLTKGQNLDLNYDATTKTINFSQTSNPTTTKIDGFTIARMKKSFLNSVKNLSNKFLDKFSNKFKTRLSP